MPFMAPIFLLGALLAVVPVIIHMFFHRRAPRVFFGTIRFLQLCVRKTARRKRIENLLLMIFRMLLFGLLAVALARPFVRSAIVGGSGPTSTVIVLDNSYSMATVHEGKPRFKTAKEIASSVVHEMSEGDSVALLLTGGPRSGGKVELKHNLNQVDRDIAQAEIFTGHTRLMAKINQAFDLLKTSSNVNREVIVITDLQEISLDARLTESALAQDDVALLFYDCGREAVNNLAITGLSLSEAGRLSKETPTLVVEIFNPTSSEIEDARLAFAISFGSCSFDEPRADLRALGLV